MLKYIGALILTLAVLLVALGALMPASCIDWLNRTVTGYSEVTSWLRRASPSMKLLHVVGYAWLAFLWSVLRNPRWRAWHVASMLLGLGILVECLQTFSAGREPRLGDVMADAVGIAIGLSMSFVTIRVVGALKRKRRAAEVVANTGR